MSASHNSTIYEKINKLHVGQHASFFGRVVSLKPPRKTGGSDYILSVVVVDDSLANHADITSPMPAGLSVNIFRPSLNELPRIENLGDIVMFRRFKIQLHNGCLQALSTRYSGWTVFRKTGPSTWLQIPHRPDELITPAQWETLRVIDELPIGTGAPVTGDGAATVFGARAFKRPLLTVAELSGGGSSRFFDIYLKVWEIVSQDDVKSVLLCTDYTQNEALGPVQNVRHAKMENAIIKVTLWDDNAAAIQRLSVRPGTILFLQNATIKIHRTDTGNSLLEAVLHGDQNGSGECRVRLVEASDPEARRLEQRAEQLEVLVGVDAEAVARLVDANAGADVQKKDMPEGTAHEKDTAHEKSTAHVKDTTHSTPTKQPPAPTSPTKVRHLADQDKQPRVRTPVLTSAPIPTRLAPTYTTAISQSGIKISSILEVRSYPSEQAKFCVRARVTDVLPGDLWSWVRVQCSGCQGFTDLGAFRHTRQCAHCPAPADHCNRWVFVFALLLDDGVSDLPVIVAAEDAEHFLGFAAGQFAAAVVQDAEALAVLLERVKQKVSRLAAATTEQHLFCLQSYRVTDEGMRYRLIETRME